MTWRFLAVFYRLLKSERTLDAGLAVVVLLCTATLTAVSIVVLYGAGAFSLLGK